MNQISLKRHDSGAVLVISLVILLVLTLIGVSSMQTSTMEERMAGNLRDQDLAFQTAEAALNEAKRLVVEHSNLFRPPDQDQRAGFYVRAYLEGDLLDQRLMPNALDDAGWEANGSTIAIGTSPERIATFENRMGELSDWPARFRVEQQPFFDDSFGRPGQVRGDAADRRNVSWRVQARSRGGSGLADAILEAGITR